MTLFLLQQIELSDPQSYDPDGIPGVGDTVRGTGNGGRNGTLNVERVENLWIANNATITANSADSITVGNFNGAGGDVTFTINGTVEGGTAVVWSNGSLEADEVTSRVQNRGGEITINGGHNVDGDSNSVVFDLQGGMTTILGDLNFTGIQSIAAVDDGGILNAMGIGFGSGESSLSVTDSAQANISGAGTLDIGDDQSLSAGNGGKFTAAQIDVAISGTGTLGVSGFGGVAETKIASLDVTGDGIASINGGLLDVQGDVKIGTTADGGQVEVFDFGGPVGTLKAQNVTVGNGIGTVDGCGRWMYDDNGTSGQFLLGNNGYASIADMLILNNADNSGLNLLATASLHVGGDGGYVAGQILVNGSGSLVGHGTLSAPTIIVNDGGVIAATEGELIVQSEVTGTGKLVVDDSAILRLTEAVSVDVEFLARADTALGHSSVLKLDDPENFTGTIKGLSSGTTVILEADALSGFTGLNNPLLSHTEIVAGELVMTFIDNVAGTVNTGTPPSVTRKFNVEGDLADHTFIIRNLTDGDIGLSFTDASDQVLTNVDGTPTNGASPYIDALTNGWGAWDPSQGPITYWFGEAGDFQDALDVHGETALLNCNDGLFVWDEDHKGAFDTALEKINNATGLTFQMAASEAEANLVWWLKDLGPGALGESENPSLMPNGHVWQAFNPTIWNADTLSFGGIGMATIIHEIGHALGLAHPHDGGLEPDRSRFPEVPFNDTQTVGLNAQNQAIFTIMSYRQGWNGKADPPGEYGTQGGLGAFDIAALQELYGANNGHNAGDGDAYHLNAVNAAGTGWEAIWDAGGVDDTISNQNSNLDATIDLRAAPLVGANAGGFVSHVSGILGGFTIANGVVIENAIGGGGNDWLIGNDADNRLEGGDGNDTLMGGLGIDTLIGGPGDDTYDIFSLDDIIMEFDSEGRDMVVASGFSLDLSDFDHVEDLMLEGADSFDLIGNGSANKLIGNGGVNILSGGAGEDMLFGNAGKDQLQGDEDNDILNGGRSKDLMWGGLGEDIFDFDSAKDSRKGSKRDKILDFNRADDLIDLSDIDAKKGGGNQKFKWIGKSDFHEKKGELRYEDKGSKVIVQGDINGNGKADFEIFVKAGKLSSNDFEF